MQQNINCDLRKKRSASLKYLNDSSAFIKYSSDMDDNNENIKEYNPCQLQKILVVFDNMISDMFSNKKF